MKNKSFLLVVLLITIVGAFKWHAQGMEERATIAHELQEKSETKDLNQEELISLLMTLPLDKQRQMLPPIDPVLYEISSVIINNWQNVQSFSFSRDGSRLVAMFAGGAVQLINTQNGQALGDWQNVQSFTFSLDGSKLFIVFADENHTSELINTQDRRVISTWQNEVYYGLFSADGSRLFIMFEDNTAQLINIQNGQTIGNWEGAAYGILSAQGSKLFIAFRDNTAQLIDAQNQHIIGTWQNVYLYDSIDAAEDSLSSDGSKLFIVFEDDTAQLIDTQNGQTIGNWQNVHTGSLNADGSRLLSIFEDDTAQLINTQNKQIIGTWQKTPFWSLFSKDGSQLFMKWPNDYTSELINTHNGQSIYAWQNAFWARFSADNSSFFIGFYDSTAQLINTQKKQIIGAWQNVHTGGLSEDGSMLFIIFRNRKARLYNCSLLHKLLSAINAKQHELLQAFAVAIKDTHNKRALRNDQTISPSLIEANKQQWQTFLSLPQEMQALLRPYIRENQDVESN